jgi:hypothetical protein
MRDRRENLPGENDFASGSVASHFKLRAARTGKYLAKLGRSVLRPYTPHDFVGAIGRVV